MTAGQRLAIGSTGIALAVLGLKGAAWWLTGSAALFADALQSTVSAAASAGTLVALRIAADPTEATSSHANTKPALVATVAEGVLAVIAAMAAVGYAWDAWTAPHAVAVPAPGLALPGWALPGWALQGWALQGWAPSGWALPDWALPDWALPGWALNAVASLLSGLWCVLLLRAGRRLDAPMLAADGRRLQYDAVASATVLVGVGLAVLAGLPWLDSLLGAAVGVYVLWAGTRLVSGSVDRLLDAAPAPAVAERIRTLVGEHAEGAIEAHGLRIRNSGDRTFLEFDLVVTGSMSVADSHAICDRIEAALQAEIGDLVITIHVEPEPMAKQHGVLVL